MNGVLQSQHKQKSFSPLSMKKQNSIHNNPQSPNSDGILSGEFNNNNNNNNTFDPSNRIKYVELYDYKCQDPNYGQYYYNIIDLNYLKKYRTFNTKIIINERSLIAKEIKQDYNEQDSYKYEQNVIGIDDNDNDNDNENSMQHFSDDNNNNNDEIKHENIENDMPIFARQRTLWSQAILSEESQYTYDSTASCTIMALECAMQLQLEHKNYVNKIQGDKDKIKQILRIASMYKSDIHTDVEDIMENISRYKNNLCKERFHQILVPNWSELSSFIKIIGKEFRSEVSCVVTKPPETVFIHFYFPLLGTNESELGIIQPLIFDSHTRTERDLHGAHMLRFEDIDSFEKYLTLLWPKVDMGNNPSLRENEVNTVNIDVITLNPQLRDKPKLNMKQLQRAFNALAVKVKPWNYNTQNSDSSVEYESLSDDVIEKVKTKPPQNDSKIPPNKACNLCTFHNNIKATKCVMCGHKFNDLVFDDVNIDNTQNINVRKVITKPPQNINVRNNKQNEIKSKSSQCNTQSYLSHSQCNTQSQYNAKQSYSNNQSYNSYNNSHDIERPYSSHSNNSRNNYTVKSRQYHRHNNTYNEYNYNKYNSNYNNTHQRYDSRRNKEPQPQPQQPYIFDHDNNMAEHSGKHTFRNNNNIGPSRPTTSNSYNRGGYDRNRQYGGNNKNNIPSHPQYNNNQNNQSNNRYNNSDNNQEQDIINSKYQLGEKIWLKGRKCQIVYIDTNIEPYEFTVRYDNKQQENTKEMYLSNIPPQQQNMHTYQNSNNNNNKYNSFNTLTIPPAYVNEMQNDNKKINKNIEFRINDIIYCKKRKCSIVGIDKSQTPYSYVVFYLDDEKYEITKAKYFSIQKPTT